MEGEFWTDIQALGNERPDLVLRVSDVIPEIVDYIQVIMKNGYAYEVGGSVYLDMEAFEKAEGFAPLRFAPKSSGFDIAFDKSKKDPRDFALWKAGKSLKEMATTLDFPKMIWWMTHQITRLYSSRSYPPMALLKQIILRWFGIWGIAF